MFHTHNDGGVTGLLVEMTGTAIPLGPTSEIVTGVDLSSSLDPSYYSQAVTFTAAVTTGGQAGTITGSVDFADSTGDLTPGGVPVNAAGVATYATSAVSGGLGTITATYSGNLPASSASILQFVYPAPTLTTVTSSDDGDAVPGETVTLTATVTDNLGLFTPTGSVVFTIDGTPSSDLPLSGSGQATTTLMIPPGTTGARYTVTAAYTNADGNFANSDDTANPFGESVAAYAVPWIPQTQSGDLANVNGTLFFESSYVFQAGTSNPVNRTELWRSNGTASGTTVVDPLIAQTDNYPILTADYFTNVNGTLFFVNGEDLYRSDGTVTSPVLENFGSLRYPTNVNGTLFFTSGHQLWRWNSPGRATVLTSEPSSPYAGDLTNVNGTLFFLDDGELWRSNGVAAGTSPVVSGIGEPITLTNVNDTLFFSAEAPGTQDRDWVLWRSDGTQAGTMVVADVPTGRGLGDFANVNGTLFFQGGDSQHGYELWRSNGTAGGTTLVADINPGTGSSYPYNFLNVQGTLFFSANDGVHGRQLWSSTGTAAGTAMVDDLSPDATEKPYALTDFDGTLFYTTNYDPYVPNDGLIWALPVAPTAATATAITASDTSPRYGETVTYTATISAVPPRSGAPADGTVTFQFDGGPGIFANVSNGRATITKQWLTVGAANTVEATFNGDDSADQFNPSTAPQLSVTVARAVAQTTVSLSNANSVYGQNWAATATVKAPPRLRQRLAHQRHRRLHRHHHYQLLQLGHVSPGRQDDLHARLCECGRRRSRHLTRRPCCGARPARGHDHLLRQRHAGEHHARCPQHQGPVQRQCRLHHRRPLR